MSRFNKGQPTNNKRRPGATHPFPERILTYPGRDGRTVLVGDMSNGRTVVLKLIRVNESSSASTAARAQLKALRTQATIWLTLQHPNLLEFGGFCQREPFEIALISPYMISQDVLTYLERYQGVGNRCSILRGIAAGLHYLHSLSPPIVHGDLRAANIIIGRNGEARITKYGLASVLAIDERAPMEAALPFQKERWQAPERLFYNRFGLANRRAAMTPEADMYSFAMTAYEIYTGHIPFFETDNIFRVLSMIGRNTKPTRYGGLLTQLTDEMWKMWEACWESTPETRPTASQLISFFATYPGSELDRGWSGFKLLDGAMLPALERRENPLRFGPPQYSRGPQELPEDPSSASSYTAKLIEARASGSFGPPGFA